MKKWFQFVSLLALVVFLLTPPLFAQENEPGQPPAPDGEETTPTEPDTPAGQEVEINEDNYRQFMELKDPMRQRDIIPENVFKPGSGLQKLDKLPEESQKHLRNQLREIIVQGDPWQPGDEETEYPFTPSVAAGTNPPLEKQEKEAWGELVDSYHDRESQIYENSSGSQAARGSEQGSSNSQQNGMGSTGSSGQDGEGSEGQQAGQEGNPNQSETEGTYSVSGSGNPDANSTAGVSQNAMEFLQGLGKGGSNAGEGNQGGSTEGAGPGGESPTPSETQSQAQTGQQAGSEQNISENSGAPGSPGDPNANSTAGTSQNAMEFLQGLGTGGSTEEGNDEASAESGAQGTQSQLQAGEQDNSPVNNGTPGTAQQPNAQSTAGTSQNAMEFLKGTSDQGGSDGEEQASTDGNGQQEDQTERQEGAQASAQDSHQDSGQSETQGDQQADGQNEGETEGDQQAEAEQVSALPSLTTSDSTSLPAETGEESTAGAAQNALEYLTGESTQPSGDTGDETDPDQQQGTLTIQDLLNAQGVEGVTPKPLDENQTDETGPDKDNDG